MFYGTKRAAIQPELLPQHRPDAQSTLLSGSFLHYSFNSVIIMGIFTTPQSRGLPSPSPNIVKTFVDISNDWTGSMDHDQPLHGGQVHAALQTGEGCPQQHDSL